MTNEQAKEILRCNTDLGNGVIIENESTQEIYEALKMAIKALEQQPSNDCERVLNRVMEYTYGMLTTEKIGLQHLIKSMIDELPPVTPTQRWIPVSERLPEEDGEYLLYGKIDEDEENYIFIGEYDYCGEQFGIWQEQFDRTTLGCLGSEFFDYSSVIAWQPLPKPYEEKRGDSDGSN